MAQADFLSLDSPIGNSYFGGGNPYGTTSGYTPAYANTFQTQQGAINQSGAGSSQVNPFDAAQQILSFGNPFSGTTGGITSAINSAGASTGLFGSGLTSSGLTAAESNFLGMASQAAGIQGPINTGLTTGALGGTASLSGVLGAGSLGAFGGGMLAGALGLNQTGGSIGGGLGAAIGMMTPLGPLGAVLGGAAGSVLGGLFGKKKAGTSADEFGGRIGATGSFGDTLGFGSKNAGGYAGTAKRLSSQLGDMFSSASSALGIKFSDLSIRGGVNTKHSPSGQAGFLGVGDKMFGFDPSNNKSMAAAEYEALKYAAEKSGYKDMTTLNDWFTQTGSYLPGVGKNARPNNVLIAPKQAATPAPTQPTV